MSKITYQDLLVASQSRDANVRKQAWEAYQKWKQLSMRLEGPNRLSGTQRYVLDKIFIQKGFKAS